MNNINLDINTYNIDELKNLLKLPQNYNSENIYNAKENIANSIRKSNISESKKTDIYIFLDNIKNKLINNLEIGLNITSIKEFNGNHYITNNNESILGNYKQTNKSTLKKIYTIDSIFRHNYELIDNQSHNYTIQLPETVTRAMSMSISSVEIPLTYHNISSYYNNNVFSIEILNLNNTPVENSYPIIIELSAGLYEAHNSSSARENAYSIEQEINDKIKAINTPTFNISQIQYFLYINSIEFAVDKKSGYSYFYYKNTFSIASYKIKINFNLNNQNAISKNCHSDDLYKKLGWQLGFRTDSIILSSTNLTANSSAICYIGYPRYIYIAIDDFQSSSQNYFAVASDSIIAPNIITRINILSLLEEKTAFKQGAYAGDIYYNQKHIREYFGPTDINKLKIQLLDEYGRNFSLNNMDWSFIITFDCLYN
jgi:hypothetical protein